MLGAVRQQSIICNSTDSPQGNLIWSFPASIHINEFENYTFKIAATSPRDHWVNFWSHLMKQTTFILAVSQVSIFADEIIRN